MKTLFFAVAISLLAPGLWAATYSITTPTYTSITNFTSPCGGGSCANFTNTMRVSGSFTTATPLAANLAGANILSQVTSFSFFDGLTTYSSANPNVRVYQFTVNTDASGNVTPANLILEFWSTGTSPHSPGDRIGLLELFGATTEYVNLPCNALGSPPSGVADTCTSAVADATTSFATATPTGGFTRTDQTSSVGAPALSSRAMALLLLLMGLFGWRTLRRGVSA